MKNLFLPILISFSITCLGQKGFKYPNTYMQDISDTIWGDVVHDPFRWLENLESDETQEWIKLQKRVETRNIGMNYHRMLRYISLFGYIDFKPIFKEGKYFFMYKYVEKEQAPSLYYQEDIKKEPRFLFNPKILDKNSSFSIASICISSDSRTLALVLSKNSGDWKTIRFLDMESRRLLPDIIENVKYSPVFWSQDGIFYVSYDVQNTSESFSENIKGRVLYYHKIGTSQKDDPIVFKPDNEYSFFSFEVTPHQQYLVVYHSEQGQNSAIEKVSLMNLPYNQGKSFRDMIASTEKNVYFNVIGEANNNLLVLSNYNAENSAIYSYDPNKLNFGTIHIPQYQERLDYAKLIGNKLLKVYNDSIQSFAVLSDLNGNNLNAWEIPPGYTFSKFNGSVNDSIAIYYFNSFFSPSSIYRINLNSFDREMISKTYILFNNKKLTTKKVYYESKDGTKIPMYVTHKKGLKMNGNNPTILYGYGGFGISMEPFFNVPNVIFLNNGGILATPCLRGGGEYPGWHEAGKRLNKQNTFDDFIAAAEYLIGNNYTNPTKLAAMGGSNGGLVVGASILQRPDLFRVVVAKAGLFDMIRYHLFNIGYLYSYEYGNVNDSLDFLNLRRYSPLHNVRKDIDYPATLLVAADNDDRVLPFHSFKFLSKLQTNGSNKNPYVLYYQENSGHSGSAILKRQIESDAYIYSFIFKHLGIARRIKYDNN